VNLQQDHYQSGSRTSVLLHDLKIDKSLADCESGWLDVVASSRHL